MTWVLVVAVVWVVLAVATALLIGRAIRLADLHAGRHAPAPADLGVAVPDDAEPTPEHRAPTAPDLDAPRPPDGPGLPRQRPASEVGMRGAAGPTGG